MDDLVQFLRDRLDDDQRTADAAAADLGPGWSYSSGMGWVVATRESDWFATGSQEWLAPEHGEHIARHDPARILAEIDAKRRMIDDTWGGPDHQDMWSHHMRLLALPYAAHPDYRDDWRPYPAAVTPPQ
ncbi:DUF6221 family protein [Streptomyces cyaneofuscatus]|uniref:DUF6221 family protein n=1 Tax=Streptomyces cyaneofuscatus TaxID=66883 RepID=UPI0036368A1F